MRRPSRQIPQRAPTTTVTEPHHDSNGEADHNSTDTTPPPPPQDTLALGYAAGAFTKVDQLNENTTAGTLISSSPTDVALLFDGTTKTFSGAVFNLFASDDGGAKITFVPIKTSDLSLPGNLGQQLENSGIFLGAAATSSANPNSSIVLYGHTLAGSPRQFDTASAETVNFGQATLIGVSGNGQVFCETCDFMKWGAWLTAVNVADHPDAKHEQSNPTDHSTQISAVGWWVTGDSLPTIDQLPTLGTATYDGHAIGQVVYYGDSQLARGDCAYGLGLPTARRRARH